VIGERDAAATDLAELDALRREAAERRAELGSTVRALAGLVSGGGLLAYALRAVRMGASGAWKVTWRTIGGPAPGRFSDRGLAQAGPSPRATAVALGLGLACVAVVALSWRTRRAAPAGRPRARTR
jgi:hypothetical protein